MKKFPAEFEDLLNTKGKKLLRQSPPQPAFTNRQQTPLAVWDDILLPGTSEQVVRLLDKHLYSGLKDYGRPIPPSLIKEQRVNYTEALPKTMKLLSAELNNSRSRSYEITGNLGLNAMLQSDSFRQFASAVTGKQLQPSPGMQVICYRAGDYSGPHNDHHPEEAHLRNGYLDVHLMFSNRYVQHQWLQFEEQGFFNRQYNIAVPAAVAVYRLPFWHATTPVIPVKGKDRLCRRWLILGSFIFKK